MTDISKGNTVSVPPFLLGGQLSVTNFERGGGIRKKNECLGRELMSPCHGYLPGGTSYVSCQKILKNKIWL